MIHVRRTAERASPTFEEAITSALLPEAADCRKKIAEVEAEKASEYLRNQAAAEAEKRALLEWIVYQDRAFETSAWPIINLLGR
jgi:hypothetical protein